MAGDDPAELRDLGALATLADPTRRALYDFIAEADRPVSRDDVATARGIDRSLAAYHLDKLAQHGLLDVTYARRSGRGGPGAGRPAKLYGRADREVIFTTPPRDYRLLAELLVRAADARGGAAKGAIEHAARDVGRAVGLEARPHSRSSKAALQHALRSRGYKPVDAGSGTIRLRNCPFDVVASRYPAIVCGLNLALIEGMLAGLGARRMSAELAPLEGACCVAIRTTPSK